MEYLVKHFDAVAAIIVYDQRVLCLQRGMGKYEYVSLKYEFPGGKIEVGEKQTEALSRELREELDLDLLIQEEDYFMTIQHEYPDFSLTMHMYTCRPNNPEFKLIEHVDYKWCTLNEISDLDWADADWPIVKRLEMVGI